MRMGNENRGTPLGNTASQHKSISDPFRPTLGEVADMCNTVHKMQDEDRK